MDKKNFQRSLRLLDPTECQDSKDFTYTVRFVCTIFFKIMILSLFSCQHFHIKGVKKQGLFIYLFFPQQIRFF